MAARLLHGVGPARSALTRTPLARPLLMPLSHAAGYTFLCTVQLCQHVVKLAMSSAECFMHGVAHASHRSTLHPAPPRPIVIEGDGAHSVALSAHSTCTGSSGVADVVADGISMLACTLTHRVTMMKTARWTPSKQSLATGYDNDGLDFSAGVGVSSIVGVHGQGVSPGVGLVVSLVVASLFSTLREPV